MTAEEVQSEYELETANVIIDRFRDLDPAKLCAVLVHSHGPFVWGQTRRQAAEYALAPEIVAEMAIKAIKLNPSVEPVPQHLLDKHYKRKYGASAYYGQAAALDSPCS